MRSSDAVRLLVVLAVASSSFSCGHTLNYDAPPTAITLPSTAEKQPVTVELLLTDDLRDSEWSEEFEVAVGKSLETNTEHVARSAFRDVVVTRGSTRREAGLPSLTPRLVAIARDRPASGFSEQRTKIFLEWSFRDSAGRPVWVETISGYGAAPLISTDVQVDAALKELFENSQQQMLRSPEIRALANQGQR